MSGVITFSLEIELGWSLYRTGKASNLSNRREKETKYFKLLLDKCDEIDIPFTFDIVGHLLLESCSGEHPGPHPKGWFDCDPGSNFDSNPLYYAPDMVEMIQKSTCNHEIATHTFSHVLFNDVSKDVVQWELAKSKEVHEEHGVGTPVSLVPPQQNIPPEEILQKNGIEVRRAPYDQKNGQTRTKHKIRRFFKILFGNPPIVDPIIENSMVVSYSSRYPSLVAPFLPSNHKKTHPVFRPIPTRIRRQIHLQNLIRTLNKSVANSSHAHLWAHLFDMANGYQWPQIETFLEKLAERRDKGDVEILTMHELAGRKNKKSQI